jgi:hypothetical protein
MKYLIYLLLFTIPLLSSFSQTTVKRSNVFTPGTIWPDNNGKHINAHGGGVLFHNGKYYWFGEFKIEGRLGNSAQVGVSCYSSYDLYNWKDEGIVLPVSADSTSEITKGCIIERPKVIYNAKTKKFVMWFHLELKGRNYSAARTGVAVSNKITGPYQYLKSYRPNQEQYPVGFREEWKQPHVGQDTLKWWTPEWRKAVEEGLFVRRDFTEGQMSRDMGLFVDDDGKAYHIHSSEENLTIHIAELTDDYLSFTGKWIQVFPGGHNEAPAMCKYKGRYYLITSGCTGWDPNAARSAVASSIWGPWKPLGNPCLGTDAEITFNSQSTFILPVQGKNHSFLFMADRWMPKNPIDGRYIWLPLWFENGKPLLRYMETWDLNVFK